MVFSPLVFVRLWLGQQCFPGRMRASFSFAQVGR
jgi:hypothetical protein